MARDRPVKAHARTIGVSAAGSPAKRGVQDFFGAGDGPCADRGPDSALDLSPPPAASRTTSTKVSLTSLTERGSSDG